MALKIMDILTILFLIGVSKESFILPKLDKIMCLFANKGGEGNYQYRAELISKMNENQMRSPVPLCGMTHCCGN